MHLCIPGPDFSPSSSFLWDLLLARVFHPLSNWKSHSSTKWSSFHFKCDMPSTSKSWINHSPLLHSHYPGYLQEFCGDLSPKIKQISLPSGVNKLLESVLSLSIGFSLSIWFALFKWFRPILSASTTNWLKLLWDLEKELAIWAPSTLQTQEIILVKIVMIYSNNFVPLTLIGFLIP